MWKLNIPSVAEVEEELRKGLKPKGKPHLYNINASEKDDLLKLYDKYDEVSGRPCTELLNTGLQPALEDALHEAYKSTYKKRRLKKLRSRLFLAARHCPFCGFGSIIELDHYLPKEHYKALSIYARNLIPSCSLCNKKKSKSASTTPSKQFVHAYFDIFPDEEFLVAKAIFNSSGMHIDFSIIKTPTMPQDLYERITHQFNVFELQDRYQPEITNFLCDLETSFKLSYTAGSKDGVKNYLIGIERDYIKSIGKNHWKTALVRALYASDRFCNKGFVLALGTPNPGA